MEAKSKYQNSSIVKSVETEKVYGELICKRVTSPYYITGQHTAGVIAELFINDADLHALGVVDKNGKALGIVLRNEIFALIGQKFGRELYLNKSITDIIKKAELIYYKRNTFSVVDEISADLKSADNSYYILVDAENSFRGIVSSFDLVLFLSDMMTRELREARRVHSAIVKDETEITTEKLSILASTVMAGETGGDFQYIRKLDESRMFITLCDVSGKGLNAGLIAVAVSSMYAAYDFDKGISGLIRRINSFIYGLFSGEIFLTGVFINIDESTGEAEVYDMGHSMLYVIKGGEVRGIENHTENFPLGIQKNIDPAVSKIMLERGDFLVAYSDGFSEQCNMSDEQFGERRLLSLAAKYMNSRLKQVRDILYEELKTWRFGQAQSDDMSLLMIKVK